VDRQAPPKQYLLAACTQVKTGPAKMGQWIHATCYIGWHFLLLVLPAVRHAAEPSNTYVYVCTVISVCFVLHRVAHQSTVMIKLSKSLGL